MTHKREETIKSIWARVFLGVFDLFWVALIAFGAFWIGNWSVTSGFDFSWKFAYWTMGNVVIAVALFLIFGLYSMIFSTAGFPEAFRILIVTGIVAVANLVFVPFSGWGLKIGYTTVLLYVLFFFCGLVGTRFMSRGLKALKAAFANAFTHKKRVMIVGCNNNA